MPDTNEIYIYDEIGPEWWGLVSDKYVLRGLDEVGKGKPVTVRINSPGGDTVMAQSIYNALRRHSDGGGKVTVEVDALAASAASYIAMAGDEILMAENSMMMIHHAWTIAMGNAEEMRSIAAILDKFDGIIADTYVARSKQDKEDIVQMLNDETWMTAAEAVELGFADSIGQPLNGISASVKSGRFNKTPERFVSDKPTPVESERIAKRQVKIASMRQQVALARKRLGV